MCTQNQAIGMKIINSLPNTKNISTLTEMQLSAELEKGYADITAGRVRAAEEVFADICKDY